MRVILGLRPNPKQEQFFLSRARHTAYGGARGGGKSWAMRTKFVLLAARFPELNLLLLRRTFAQLRENHVVPLQRMLAGVARYRDAEKVFLFPNGARLKLGYCDAEDDVYQYQGQEYDAIGLEEATHFSEAQAQFLTTCCRTVRGDFTPRMYYTCNPGGVGHGWVKRLFVDRRYQDGERAGDYVFIPARVTDNHVLMRANPEYLRALEALPEGRRRAYLHGDWDALEGQFFEEFRRDLHVVPPFAIPAHWRRFRSLDWGYADPCCVLWHATAPEGRVYTYRELYVTRTLARDVAERVAELSAGERISYTAASPDMWHRRGQADLYGESIADTFTALGVPLLRADNARAAGWQRMREFLAPAPDGKPLWQVFACCQNLIRTLPMLLTDPNRAEDAADGQEDHAPEAARYGLMSRPAPNKVGAGSAMRAYDPLSVDVPVKGGFLGM